MFFFLFYFFEIMNLIKLSNNKFTNKYISNQYIPYTNYKNNISFLQCPKDNPPYIFYHNDSAGLFNFTKPFYNQFEQVSQSTCKAIVFGYAYYVTGMIFISQPTKLIIDFYNKSQNITKNILTINITKQNCYFYISELFSKGMTGHWDDNSYVLCQIESNESYIDCSKLYLSNWVY